MADPGNVINVIERGLAPDFRPGWCDVAGLGIFRLGPGATFDRHFHDSVEYWLFYRGKAKVAIEDETFYVQSGDVVCTPVGAVHDVLEMYEPMEAFYLEEALPPGGRLGHLHRNEMDAAGHPVPILALPGDFPAAASPPA